MKLPPPLVRKLIDRFEVLIAEGEEILRTAKSIPAQYKENWVTQRIKSGKLRAAYQELDWPDS